MTRKQKKTLKRILVSLVLTGILFVSQRLMLTKLPDLLPNLSHPELFTRLLTGVLYLVPYLIIGIDILKKAVRGILNGQVFDENFLMAIATVGAFVLAFVDTGDYLEAVAVMLFYQTGELFQSIAVGRSRKNITELMNLRPESASVEENGEILVKEPEEVSVGSILVIRPGEKVPIDGVVYEGSSTLDTSALTGESLPRSVSAGDEVLSGSINRSSVLRIKTTKPFGESAVSKIMELVENASSKKSRSEQFITKFARVYTPAVCIAALAIAVIPPLCTMQPQSFLTWIYRALSFLVISCPCALVISIPLGFFAGLGGASGHGVLVKGSSYFEGLAKVDTVVFDKTGTLTEGCLGYVETASSETGNSDAAQKRILYYAAHAEAFSTHPIGSLIRASYWEAIDASIVSEVTEFEGEGLTAMVDGSKVLVGSLKLMNRYGIQTEEGTDGRSEVYVAIDGIYRGRILLNDRIKETSREAVLQLKQNGIRECVMLTGDKKEPARKTAELLGIDTVFAELLPGDKVGKVEELLEAEQKKQNPGRIAFVGDGINDAPVLMRVDIGIAMGGIGSDAAIEAADVVLMDDDPMKVVLAIKMARKCMRIVYENIYFAIGVKLLCLLMSALGLAGMGMAIFADVGVMVLAVLNAIRALKAPKV